MLLKNQRKITTIIFMVLLLFALTAVGFIKFGKIQILPEKVKAGVACGSSPYVCPGCDELCYGKNDGDTCTGGNGTCVFRSDLGYGCTCNTSSNPTDYIVTCTSTGTDFWHCGDCGGFCISKNSPYTCQQVAVAKCGSSVIGNNSCPSGTTVCYYCPLGTPGSEGGGQQCKGTTPLPADVSYKYYSTMQCDIVGSWCGIIQCDSFPFATYYSELNVTGCSPTPTPPMTTITTFSTPTKTPTITPTAPIASCFSLKAYSTNWTELTPTNLSALKTGSQVYFCAKGSTNIGNFDKARFSINGGVRPETTLIRPNQTNEFCDLYTLPNGVYNFNVSAEMHHATLGWVQ